MNSFSGAMLVRQLGKLALPFLAACIGYAQVGSFGISQAYPILPTLTGYLDITDPNGQQLADVRPENLSGTLGSKSLTVTGVVPFDSSGEGVGYVFLIDISKSIRPAQFGEIQKAIGAWIDGMKDADQAAIAVFGESYRVIADFTKDKDKLHTALQALAPAEKKTVLYMAIDRAMDMEQRKDPDLPNRRVVVVLSDGKDEGSPITIEDLIRKVHKGQPVYVRSPLPVYAIGFSTLPKRDRAAYLGNLQRIATLTGGAYREGGAEKLEDTYAAIQQAIRRVYVAKLGCKDCPADGRSYPLEVTFKSGTTVLADRINVVPIAAAGVDPAPLPVATPPVKPWWIYALIALGVIALAGTGIALWQRSEKRKQEEKVVVVPSITPTPTPFPVTGGRQPVVEAPGLRLILTTVIGKDAGQTRELSLVKTLKIGRSKECDVVVADDPKVSNRHCEMALVNGQVVIYDLQSTNTTVVNGVPISGRQKLETRDTIQVGDTEFRLRFGE